MYEVFIEQLNAIYFDGYAENLADTNPEAFNFEMNQFFNNY